MTIRVFLIDDHALVRTGMRLILGTDADIEVVGEAESGEAALPLVRQLKPDVVLMDIEMPEMDGLEAARHLAAMDLPPAVVFCTAYDEHALAAFEAAAVDYLLKPVRAERLGAALQRAAERRAGRQQSVAAPAWAGRARTHLAARLRGSLRLMPVADIRYLQAEEKYVVVHHARGLLGLTLHSGRAVFELPLSAAAGAHGGAATHADGTLTCCRPTAQAGSRASLGFATLSSLHDFLTLSFLATLILGRTFCS